MAEIVIDHPHSEASALLGIQNIGYLASRGWDAGFWIVSDELEAERAIASLGRTASGAWEVAPLQTTRGDRTTSKTCEDCETLARAGSRVYIFGSHYGTKKGPLQAKRHFVARFNEALIDASDQARPAVPLDVARRPFVLHRLINDALRAMEIELRPVGAAMKRALILETIRDAKSNRKSWSDLVRRDDAPLNIEGATFIEGGLLLLGLRHPVTIDGHPLIVELEGIDRLFEDGAPLPIITAIRILENVGSRRRPAGIRELDSREGRVHAITGDIDEELLVDPKGAKAANEHWLFPHPLDGAAGPSKVTATRVRTFDRKAQVEGIALIGNDAWYVHDDAKIRLEQAPLG